MWIGCVSNGKNKLMSVTFYSLGAAGKGYPNTEIVRYGESYGLET
jgi:hypothetical protein